MSSLYLYTKERSLIDNKISLFYNLLSNNYYNTKLETTSISYNIYDKILNVFSDDINISKDITYDTFTKILNKYLYQTLNKTINEYTTVMIKRTEFLQELFKYTSFQYYTNSQNEVLRLLSDNNTTENKTFNISKNYNKFKIKYINNQKNKRKSNIQNETLNDTKNKLYEIYISLDGLEKLMFNKYNNLIKYDNYTFNQVTELIKQHFGTSHLNQYTKDTIYFKYNNNTLDYMDIYTDIMNYPDLKDKIVLLFIENVYIKFNERIDEIILYEKYRKIITKLYNNFLKDSEDDDDDEIIMLSINQKDEIIKRSISKLYNKFNKQLLENFKSEQIDLSKYTYTNVLGHQIETKLEKISTTYINNIDLSKYKQNKTTNSIIIQESDIINKIVPQNTREEHNITYNLKNNEIINEAISRLDMLTKNKSDIDYINHTINFFKDNFESEENLEELIKAITLLNEDFIQNFNTKVLVLKNNNTDSISLQDSNLINNILENESNETQDVNVEKIEHNDNIYIISDYNILSPVYTTNFKINMYNKTFVFKTLLHYIYFNQYLKLYKVYCKYTTNKEALIIPTYKFAYNLLFKKSSYNIVELTKNILSNNDSFKNYTELQESYYTLLNHIKYFLFKYEINIKINSNIIPYFNFILSYSDPLNIIYSDKYDDYLGIGKYGNGENKVGNFLKDYRQNIDTNYSYDHNTIFLIMCNFNNNIYNWFKFKEQEIYNTLICCCIITNTFTIDITFINNIIKTLYPSYNYTKIHNLPMINTYKTYLLHKLITLSESYNVDIYNISDNAIEQLWYTLITIIHTLFDFQQQIIENSDSFQTFISLYDKQNTEHILYYILSLTNNNDVDEAVKHFTNEKINQLKTLQNIDTNCNIYQFSLNILFNKRVGSEPFEELINTYNKQLEFDVNNETKYINIINSKLKLPQK